MGLTSEAEQQYISSGIQNNLRNDGRTCYEYRPIEFQLGVIPQASGSARLHIGSTDVVVGVKVEVGSPDPATPDQGHLHVSVECSPCASPTFEGKGGEEWASQLSSILGSSLSCSGREVPAGERNHLHIQRNRRRLSGHYPPMH
jgi:exosome complex component RRP42